MNFMGYLEGVGQLIRSESINGRMILTNMGRFLYGEFNWYMVPLMDVGMGMDLQKVGGEQLWDNLLWMYNYIEDYIKELESKDGG